MNTSIKILILLTIIALYIYFAYRKHYFDFFTNSISKLEINISDKNILWLHPHINNYLLTDKETSTPIFKKSKDTFYANQPIYETGKHQGFYIKTNKLKNIKIGLHGTNLEYLKNPISNIDFGFHFNEENTLQIIEFHNPILGNAEYSDYITQNIDYCELETSESCTSKTTYQYSDKDFFGIIIHNNIVNYVLIRENVDKQSAILLHKSKNKIKYPVYPCIINNRTDNIIPDTPWLDSQYEELGPIESSVEYLTKHSYHSIVEPPQETLHDLAPTITDTPSAAPAPADKYTNLPPWERMIQITTATLYNRMLNIHLKLYNIDQTLLNNLYGVNILLTKKDTQKKLSIPLNLESKLELNDNKMNLELNIAGHLNYFYKKNIDIQVLFRLGEFTEEENIVSDSYSLFFN